MIVVDPNTDDFSDVSEREAFARQLRGTHMPVHKSARHSYLYARSILLKPFSDGEAAIACSAHYSYYYALYVLKEAFPAGEATMTCHAKISYLYAKYVLCKPWPPGEDAIATNKYYSYAYAEAFNLKLVDGEFQA